MVILFSVNAGNVIKTRREVVEAVLLMLFKFLISFVHPEASWSEGAFPLAFLLSYFLLTCNTKASDLKGDLSFLSFVNMCCLIFSLL